MLRASSAAGAPGNPGGRGCRLVGGRVGCRWFGLVRVSLVWFGFVWLGG